MALMALYWRAAIGYPWIFNEIKHYLKTGQHLPKPSMKDRIESCKEHLRFSLNGKAPFWGGKRDVITPTTLNIFPTSKNTECAW